MFTKIKSLSPWLWVPVLVGFALRLAILIHYGPDLNLNSDDVFYLDSAKVLLTEGKLVYVDHTEPTVHIMPGLPFLVAGVFFFFGTGTAGLTAAKVVMILLGCISIAGVYKIGERLFSPLAGSIAAMILALYVPIAVSDNLIATEAPTTAAFVLFVYFSLRLGDTYSMKDFYWVIGTYLFMIMFRPTVALFPVLLLVYLAFKAYPVKIAFKQFAIAAALLLVVLGPWWARNYIVYDAFIPLSGGAGNPMLLGTYQAHGYKYGPTSREVIAELVEKYPEASRFQQNIYQMEAAKERIERMREHNPEWLKETYTTKKFEIQWKAPFYWIEVFSITAEKVRAAYQVLIWAGVASFFMLLALKLNRWRELFYLFLFFAYFTVMNNVYFAYPRYNQPLMPFVFLFIGGAFHLFGLAFSNSRQKKSSTSEI
jgi:4-amino-4-deoxy-L-arabinose transferase-like glycosyltransferase